MSTTNFPNEGMPSTDHSNLADTEDGTRNTEHSSATTPVDTKETNVNVRDTAVENVGSHPLGTTLGAVGGGALGAVVGLAAGPVGSLAGAAAGAALGGSIGSASGTGPGLDIKSDRG